MKTIDQTWALKQFKDFVNYEYDEFEWELDTFHDDAERPVLVNKTQGTFIDLSWVITDYWEIQRSAEKEIQDLQAELAESKKLSRDMVEAIRYVVDLPLGTKTDRLFKVLSRNAALITKLTEEK